MRHSKKLEKTKHQKKMKWWDTKICKACVLGDKNFMKKLSTLRGRKVKYTRSKTNGVTEAIKAFEKMIKNER